MIMVSRLIGAMVLLTAAVRAAGWRDEFDGPKLNPRWTFDVPVPGPSLKLGARPGWLRLVVPQTAQGFNHWTGIQRAPFLRTTAPKGDWDLSARINLVEWKPESNLHLALVVGTSDERVLAWGPFLSRALYPDHPKPALWVEPTGQGAYIQTDVLPENVEVRISKRVDTYRFLYRKHGEKRWTEAGSFYGPDFTPRFVGLMGKSFAANPAGALDVDYLELKPYRSAPAPAPLEARLRVDIEAPAVRLPEYQRGAFIEMLGSCVFQGIWDERLTNRKFTGAAGPDGVVWQWEVQGRVRSCAPDRRLFFAEPQSQRIELDDGAGGVVQSGLVLEPGRMYRARIAARVKGAVQRLQVTLQVGKKAIAHEFTVPNDDWHSYTCEIECPAGTDPARFSIGATGPGTLWIGAASLMPADNVGGFRRDLLDVIRLAPPSMIRWPGGNMVSGYQWRDGVGDPDRRPMRWDRAWNAWVYNDMGTDEFIEYCRFIGAEPCICVNAGEGTAEQAAQWVEYCNGGPETPMGRLRAANGHRAPYNVRYWDVGNEIWGPWQLGHVGPEVYGLRAVEFARAMRRASPDIVLVGCGVFRDDFDRWNRRMLPICGQFMDLLSVHNYVEYDIRRCTAATWEKVVGAPVRIESALRETFRIARTAAGKTLPLAFDEWNAIPHMHGCRGGQGLPEAVYAAGMFHALQRCGENVPIANYALLVNPIGAVRTTSLQVIQTPVFLTFRLFAAHTGPWRIPVRIQSPNLGKTPVFDASATLSADRATLNLTAINRHPSRSLRVRWNVPGVRPGSALKWSVISGPEPWARNTAENPRNVRMRTFSGTWSDFASASLPPAAVIGASVRLK
ncbi:MAG: hypothetical protein GXP31_10280 [Kiritimatiellaeota bacterium]|nr:hypothetical protein [Kiritimatiellota bacterium]